MSTFEKAVAIVLKNEGGYVNDPKDPGGETNFGITKRTYPTVDIKNLTKEKAAAIYKRDFWDPYPYDDLVFADLAIKVFDTSVNVGQKRAFRFLQQAANTLGATLVVDGVWGPKTTAAVNRLNQGTLLSVYREVQANYYKGLVVANPTLSKFLRGWLRRAEE